MGQGRGRGLWAEKMALKFSFIKKGAAKWTSQTHKINLVHDLAQFIKKSDFAPEYCDRFVCSFRKSIFIIIILGWFTNYCFVHTSSLFVECLIAVDKLSGIKRSSRVRTCSIGRGIIRKYPGAIPFKQFESSSVTGI